jgi:AraC family transcriptional regulator of adaptative response / DNA-3-methyladenine glycosylase II
MSLDPETCYRALSARDARFDGVFYVGVTSTGVYCRPICPARTPVVRNCQFFGRAAEAERAGFRACLRCRPELAPGAAPVDAISRLVTAAAAQIATGALDQGSVAQLAARLGVSARHLRRAMQAELGVAPLELAQRQRMAVALQLLRDSQLGLTEVAFAAGFSSVRRFNALFQQRFGRPPSALRRATSCPADRVRLRLEYRPPLDWAALLGFLAQRAVPGVEAVAQEEYRRAVLLDGRAGWLRVRPAARGAALVAELSASLVPVLLPVVARLRALFDLDARPDVIDRHLARDPLLRPLVATRPGLRVPGAFDGFELAVRSVLGQQVSVAAATTLCGRLVQRFGRPLALELPGLDRTFPAASQLAAAGPAALAAIGLPGARAGTLAALARAVAGGELGLGPAAGPEQQVAALQRIRGIGPWTAHYMAMRALRWPDACPAGDLVLRRALGVSSERAAALRMQPLRPWRAYATMHLWQRAAQEG